MFGGRSNSHLNALRLPVTLSGYSGEDFLVYVLFPILLWAGDLGVGGVKVFFLRALTSSLPLSYLFQISVPCKTFFLPSPVWWKLTLVIPQVFLPTV